jgi:hypothetical protein
LLESEGSHHEKHHDQGGHVDERVEGNRLNELRSHDPEEEGRFVVLEVEAVEGDLRKLALKDCHGFGVVCFILLNSFGLLFLRRVDTD